MAHQCPSSAFAALVFCAGALCFAVPVQADEPVVTELPSATEAPPAETDGLNDTFQLFGNYKVSQVDFGSIKQTWNLIEIGGVVELRGGQHFAVSAQRETRASLDYWRLEGRFEGGNEQKLAYYVGASAGIGDPVRENWSLSAGLHRSITPQFTLSLDTRIARYDSAVARGGPATLTATPGIRYSPSGTGFVFSSRWINFWDVTRTHRQGYAFDANWYYGDANFVFAGLAHYPETDSGVTRTMRAAHVGVRHHLNNRVGLRLTGERLERVGSYRQLGLTFGIDVRL